MTAEQLVTLAERLQAFGEQLLNAGDARAHKVLHTVNVLIEESRTL